MSATTFAWLVLAFPLAGSLLTALAWRKLPGRTAGLIGTVAVAGAFVCALLALLGLLDQPEHERQLTSALWNYASVAGIEVDLGILLDPLSAFMALVVSGVSTLIHLYSLAYMSSDRGYRRFFSYLNFFVFSMLLLVLAGNFVLLIVGWAFVGFASYALISFWYRRRTATAAGMKAFVINVIGDVGLVLGAFVLFRQTESFDFLTVFERAPQVFAHNEWEIAAACLLFLVGAFAKSAQLPLHTWLADAMEGPTPVSALIHAATMVTAGVYLIARTHPLFELAPTAADVAAFAGLATVLFAASVALVVTDLKRIIAYSTMSQVGFMVVGVSIGAYGAGLFHLMTHAFFKALLFMGAGSVIAAMASRQDIDRMGGFRRAMPVTYVLVLIGALALAGFPGTSGFFSKDEILVLAAERGSFYWVIVAGGYLAALMTAFYSFRIVFRVFHGPECPEARELAETGHLPHGEPENPLTGEAEDTGVGFPGAEHHIAERTRPMAWAMGVLGVLALFGGLVQVPGLNHLVNDLLEPTFANSAFAELHASDADAWLGLGIGSLVALAGIGIAWYVYVLAPGTTDRLRMRLSPVHGFLARKWYWDELIDAAIVRPALAVGRFANSVFERAVVGGLVDGAVGAVRGGSAVVRVVQSGFLRFYALALVVGFAAIALYFLIVSS